MAKEAKTFNTKELASEVGMTGKALRRHLRKMDKYADGKYTAYEFNKTEYARLVKVLGKGASKQEAEQVVEAK